MQPPLQEGLLAGLRSSLTGMGKDEDGLHLKLKAT